jgi:hypothetical protein
MLLGIGGLTAGADSRGGILWAEETDGLLLWLSSFVLSKEGRPLLDVEIGLSVLHVAEAGILGVVLGSLKLEGFCIRRVCCFRRRLTPS